MINFAHSKGHAFVSAISRSEQKHMGQFMTPPQIASFMARGIVADVDHRQVRVLEPAAGAGILAAAVVMELIAKECPPAEIDLLMFELDERLVAGLQELGNGLETACKERGVVLDWKVIQEDFLLSDIATVGVPPGRLLVISNPPYFKIGKQDPRALAHKYAVYGQPNIYGLFMAACARLVADGGKWCFITPRSWMSGSYFSQVRRTMFSCLTVDALHSFESRKEHFAGEAILQEALITWATGTVEVRRPDIRVSRSVGLADLGTAKMQKLPAARIAANGQGQGITLPAEGDATEFDAWTDTLAVYGFKVSTGPVVPFRSESHLREFAAPGTVPLLWMQHVSASGVKWPIQKKREHIQAGPGSAWMLVKNVPMVLMRRFSPNENTRRINAAAYSGDLPGTVIGLENHLNYIYRPHGEMSVEEARGLAAFLGSSMVDREIRSMTGSTQVNALDLRNMRLPPLEQLVAIGRSISATSDLAAMDEVVERTLRTAAVVIS